MTYYAEKDATGKVLRVVVCDSLAWLQTRLGGTWVLTTDSDPAKQYAGIGMYDSQTVAPRQFIPDWRQPVGSEDAYPNAAWVWHNGRAWRSLVAANVWEPGVAAWREMLVEWPAWVQPVGSVDAYQIGEKVTFNGQRYICNRDNVAHSPAAWPAAWDAQG